MKLNEELSLLVMLEKSKGLSENKIQRISKVGIKKGNQRCTVKRNKTSGNAISL